MDKKIKNGGSFHSYVAVYQRVTYVTVDNGITKPGMFNSMQKWYVHVVETSVAEQKVAVHELNIGARRC